mmetsp:Transcript_20595/g.28905  ORF Transcript_20595/g.28905 Transcript_20595/m.28905 type:complete len:108 (-) Transcript_20595:634-957(-)
MQLIIGLSHPDLLETQGGWLTCCTSWELKNLNLIFCFQSLDWFSVRFIGALYIKQQCIWNLVLAVVQEVALNFERTLRVSIPREPDLPRLQIPNPHFLQSLPILHNT